MGKNVEDKVEIVNGLLEQTFGKNTRGNCMRIGRGEYATLPYGRLRLIVRKGKEIGHFNPPYNGSLLTLNGQGFLWKDRRRANKYSKLYEAEFGKKVKIKYRR
jgi:hypothetical protein